MNTHRRPTPSEIKTRNLLTICAASVFVSFVPMARIPNDGIALIRAWFVYSVASLAIGVEALFYDYDDDLHTSNRKSKSHKATNKISRIDFICNLLIVAPTALSMLVTIFAEIDMVTVIAKSALSSLTLKVAPDVIFLPGREFSIGIIYALFVGVPLTCILIKAVRVWIILHNRRNNNTNDGIAVECELPPLPENTITR